MSDTVEIGLQELFADFRTNNGTWDGFEKWRTKYTRSEHEHLASKCALVIETAARVTLRVGAHVLQTWTLLLGDDGRITVFDANGVDADGEETKALADALWLYKRRAIEDAASVHYS